MFIDSVKEYKKKVYQEGRREEKVKSARIMLEKGAEIDFIVDVTGLTAEEIEKIRLSMNL